MNNQLQPSKSLGLTLKNIINSKWLKISLLVLFVIVLVVISYLIYKSSKNKSSSTPDEVNTKDLVSSDNNTVSLMLFYTTWCPHCKVCKPEWEKTKEKYSNTLINGYKVDFIDVDCTNESSKVDELMNQYKVEGFPTVVLVKNKEVIKLDSNPTVETLEQFLNGVL